MNVMKILSAAGRNDLVSDDVIILDVVSYYLPVLRQWRWLEVIGGIGGLVSPQEIGGLESPQEMVGDYWRHRMVGVAAQCHAKYP